jgi:hypothetical protein
MIDGIVFAKCCCVVAFVVTTDSTKVPVGLWDGDTENATVVKDLLADLVARDLSYEGGSSVCSTARRHSRRASEYGSVITASAALVRRPRSRQSPRRSRTGPGRRGCERGTKTSLA